MKIYLITDAAVPTDELAPIEDRLSQWITEQGTPYRLIKEPGTTALDADEVDEWRLGLELDTTKKNELKEPLNFLYHTAQAHELEFVVGKIDQNSGTREAVCYFGFEEGRPDLHEIGLYLGLKR